MRILFLCNKSPWPPKEGGPMAMNMLIEGLIAEGHLVKVLAVNSHKYNITKTSIPVAYQERTGIELIDVDLRIRPLAAFFNLFTGKSYHVVRFISEKFRTRLKALLVTGKFDVVQLETLFMCPYIGTIREHSQAKIILRAHNVEHLIWKRIAKETKNPVKKWYIDHLTQTLKRYEDSVKREVDGLVAITPKDADYFRSSGGDSITPVIDIPFGIGPGKYGKTSGEPGSPSLFSLGSMNWIPNQEGIRWFLDHVWPDVHNQFPRLNYYLAGREMPGWMRSLKLPNVIVAGEVENSADFMASKSIMIVPLFSGSGIRVKIIEGMAAGKTIIATTVGAEGIRYNLNQDILIADSPCEFFEAISLCVTDPSLCAKIGDQARMLIKNEYDPKILVGKLIAFYQQLAG